MRLLTVLALSLAMAAPSLAAAEPYIIDQRCEPEIGSQQSILFYSPIGQEFVPALSVLDVVEFWISSLSSPDGPADAVVRVRRGSGGEILGESMVTTVPADHDAPVRFDFTTPVALVPGETHFLEVVHAGGPGNILLSAGDGDPYPPGHLYLHGVANPSGDYWFRTGAQVSTPVHKTTWGELKGRYR